MRAHMSIWVSALSARSARIGHMLAIRRKCDRKAGVGAVPANCMHSAAKRLHSNTCFCELSDLDMARHL